MNALTFFRREDVQALLERASRAAGVPLSVHFVERNQEGAKVAGGGRCAACHLVAETPGGKRACRQSRVSASAMALRQQRMMPFLCHMGFACVATPALPGEGFVLTFGPYTPAGESKTLELDAISGLQALTDLEYDAFPATLDDIHHAPDVAVPAVAEWTVETLRALWAQEQAAEAAVEAAEPEPEPETTPGRRRNRIVERSGCETALAAAIAADNPTQARALLKGALEEVCTGRRTRIGIRRARVLAAVAAALEAMERAGMACAAAWDLFPVLAAQLHLGQNDAELLDAAMGLLNAARRERPAKAETDAADSRWDALNRILLERLAEGVTLQEAAAMLGQTPSAISHRLDRKFGMSYSDYLARLRTEEAKRLLRHTKLSATAIGPRVGIRDQSNFTKTFKRFIGMTPVEYREQHGRKR